MSREEKIAFLLSGERELRSICSINYSNKYGDFSGVSDEELDEMVEELDWLWK